MPDENGEPTAEEMEQAARENELKRRAKREAAIMAHVEDCELVALTVFAKYPNMHFKDVMPLVSAAIVSLAINDLEATLSGSLRGIENGVDALAPY